MIPRTRKGRVVLKKKGQVAPSKQVQKNLKFLILQTPMVTPLEGGQRHGVYFFVLRSKKFSIK